MHAGDQCSGVTCRTECQLEVTAGDHAGDGENCPGLLSTRGDGVLVTLNPIGGPVGRCEVHSCLHTDPVEAWLNESKISEGQKTQKTELLTDRPQET